MKKGIMILLAVLFLVPLLGSNAQAQRKYMKSVNNTCGTNYDCSLCHVNPRGGGTLTADGEGFLASGHDPCYFCPDAPGCGGGCADADGDGYPDAACGGTDCDDTDPNVNPGAAETCGDGVDNNCDGQVDEGCGGGTCDNCSAIADKGTCNGCANCEWVGSPKNGSCQDAATCADADGDGYTDSACGGTDCNDGDASVNPGANEVCGDGVDNNCDGQVDEGCGGACSDYTDKNSCNAANCCTWNNKQKACEDDTSDPSCGGGSTRDVVVMATNDLGMHCACPGATYFLLLPPFNTLRAQVIERGLGSPVVLSDPNDITVAYNVVENTDANLQADPYFQDWIVAAPKLFPGFEPIDPADGKIQGLAGAKLDGEMHAQNSGWWEVVGIPAFPDVSSASSSQDKIMTDPFGGGPNRNPYLTGNIKVYDNADGSLLAETNTVVPVAFGGCCGCHLQVATDYGYTATPENSFTVMGMLHERDSGINIAQMDPDGDGTVGPVRCSQCHLDPAMGENNPPGYQGYPTSQYTFSDVLHRYHVQSTAVLTNYDPNIANNCYQCHPGNNVDCYRGHHLGKSIWCSDCHGDLNQRVAEGQLLDPWSQATLPLCEDCHSNTGEGGGNLNIFGGAYLNSMGHKSDAVLCSTCHGEPHALYPSSLAKDNAQNIALQNDNRSIGVCDVCHTGRSTTWGIPQH